MTILRWLMVVCLMATAGGAVANGTIPMAYFSATLQRDVVYRVCVPADRDGSSRFPVLYVLHGAMGGSADWPSMTNAPELVANYRMILVFPEGGHFGWYVDCRADANSSYETFLVNELVKEVDRRLPTVPRREARGIMGMSMGGHGALSLAAKHPGVFGSASSLSGILDLEAHPDQWELPRRLGSIQHHRPNWQRHSVFRLVEQFRDHAIPVLFDCGVDDVETGAIEDGRRVRTRMIQYQVPHIWREFPGSHTWEYWGAHLPEHLDFHQSMMVEPSPMQGPQRVYFERLGEFYRENALLAMDPPTTPTIVLLGGTLVEEMGSRVLAGHRVFNRGIAHDRLTRNDRAIGLRLEPSVFDLNPQVLVIAAGHEDLATLRQPVAVQTTVAALARVLDAVAARLPATRVVLVATPPSRELHGNIATLALPYRDALAELATERGAHFVDFIEVAGDSMGMLRDEFTSESMQMNDRGHQLLAQRIAAAAGEDP